MEGSSRQTDHNANHTPTDQDSSSLTTQQPADGQTKPGQSYVEDNYMEQMQTPMQANMDQGNQQTTSRKYQMFILFLHVVLFVVVCAGVLCVLRTVFTEESTLKHFLLFPWLICFKAWVVFPRRPLK